MVTYEVLYAFVSMLVDVITLVVVLMTIKKK